MQNISTDRRSMRTKKLIRDALSELIEEKGYNNISITDLTLRANINRGTFYLHYTDKYDLLEKIEDEMIQELHDITKDVSDSDSLNMDSVQKPMPYMAEVFKYFKDNAKFMKAILSSKGDPIFQLKLKKLIDTFLFEKNLLKSLNLDNLIVPEEYFMAYVLSAHLGVLQQWLESGMEKSPEEMALILSRMFLLSPFNVAGLTSPE